MRLHLRTFWRRITATPLTGWSSLMLGPLVFAGLLLLVLWAGTFTRIRHEEKLRLDSAFIDNSNIAKVIATGLDETLGKTNLYADMANAIALQKKVPFDTLNSTFSGDRAFLRLVIFDPEGKLVYSSVRSTKEPMLSALLAKTKAKPDTPPRLIVGHADAESGDDWRIPVLLPLGDEAKLGFLGGHLDLGYFLRLYQNVNLGQSGKIEIISDTGHRLIESSGITISPGHNMAASEYFKHLQTTKQGTGIVRRPGETFDSVVAHVKLDHYPLTVAISRSYADVLAENHARKTSYLRDAVAQTIALLLAAIGLAVLARRQLRLYKAVQKSEQKNRALIEQLEQEKNKAYMQATHDHLTGLPNRMLFAEVATCHLPTSHRSQHLSAVFFIDLDRFKLINDTLGHRVGDLLLCEVAKRLRSSIRESDLVSRFGGDEFVMLISEASSIEDLELVASKVISAVGQPCVNLDGHDLEVHPSLGIAIYGKDGKDIDTLIKCADAAMYEAKAAGRGTFRFFNIALNRASEMHVALAQRMRHAITENEFCLHYQARVSLSDYQITGLEALVRWQHPEFGLLSPDQFIPMAEEEGLIIPLGYWVIETACAQLVSWRAQGIPIVPIAVNVSPKQLRDGELVEQIFTILETYSLPGEFLEIEVTESCVIDNLDMAVKQLNKLRARGIRVLMDDYGIGFSNLSLLKSLPIHIIKIDRSLINDIHNHPSDAIIVDSTITLAHKLHFMVIAEGVETREQVMHLKVAGCDEVQGYYFHRPAPAKEIESLLHIGELITQ